MSKESIESILAEAWKARVRNDHAKALDLANKAKQLCSAEDHLHLGYINHILMQVQYDKENHKAALPYNEQTILHYLKADDPARIAHAIRHRADLQRHLEKWTQAEIDYRTAMMIYKELAGSPPMYVANTQRGLALTLEKTDNHLEALEIWQACQQIYQDHQIQEGVDEAQQHIDSLSQ